jgi:hypothetical protein
MKRLWPWLLPIAVYGGLFAVTAMMVAADWLATQHLVVIAVLLLLYAGATVTFGPWRALVLAAVPGALIGDLALFIDADANDCYPSCDTYATALGVGLNVWAALYLLVMGFAIRHLAHRGVERRRSRSRLRLGR